MHDSCSGGCTTAPKGGRGGSTQFFKDQEVLNVVHDGMISHKIISEGVPYCLITGGAARYQLVKSIRS